MSKRLSALAVLAAALLVAVTAGCIANKADLKIMVRGPDGPPLSGAKVVSDTQPEGQLKVTGLTGDDGFVTFSGIKAGNYDFTVSRFGYEPREVSYTVVAGHMQVTVTLTKSPG